MGFKLRSAGCHAARCLLHSVARAHKTMHLGCNTKHPKKERRAVVKEKNTSYSLKHMRAHTHKHLMFSHSPNLTYKQNQRVNLTDLKLIKKNKKTISSHVDKKVRV